MNVYAIGQPPNPTRLWGDKTREGDPHKNYEVKYGAPLEVLEERPSDRFYKVATPAAEWISKTYPDPYNWNWVRYEDVSVTAPTPPPTPEPGEIPTDAEVGRVLKYLFGK